MDLPWENQDVNSNRHSWLISTAACLQTACPASVSYIRSTEYGVVRGSFYSSSSAKTRRFLAASYRDVMQVGR